MKNFLLFGFILLSATRVFGQYSSNLIVFSEQGEQFWLVINGVKQNTDAQTNVKVTGLNQPNYKIKAIFKDNTVADLDKTVYLMDGGNPVSGEFTYQIKKNNKNEYVMRAFSYVPIAQAAPPAPGQTIIVYGALPTSTIVTTTQPVGTVTQQTTTTTTTTGDPNAVNVNMNVGGVGMGINMNVTGMDMTGTSTSTTTTTTTGGTMVGGTTVTTTQPTGAVYVPGYSGPTGCPYPMAPSDFDAARNSIAGQSFDDTKLTIAKQVVGSNCITAQQVKDIMGLFSFEANKLDFAKFAYGHTYDRGNYFKVNDAFTFSGSVDELNSYIAGH